MFLSFLIDYEAVHQDFVVKLVFVIVVAGKTFLRSYAHILIALLCKTF